VLGGESLFANEFVAEDGPGQVTFAPGTPGDVMEHDLNDETLYTTDGAFLAATPGVDIDSELGGLKSVLGEASLTPRHHLRHRLRRSRATRSRPR
jgi:uncharacterized protein (AIM24 family)